MTHKIEIVARHDAPESWVDVRINGSTLCVSNTANEIAATITEALAAHAALPKAADGGVLYPGREVWKKDWDGDWQEITIPEDMHNATHYSYKYRTTPPEDAQ